MNRAAGFGASRYGLFRYGLVLYYRELLSIGPSVRFLFVPVHRQGVRVKKTCYAIWDPVGKQWRNYAQ